MSVDAASTGRRMPASVLCATIAFATLTGALAVLSFFYSLGFSALLSTGEAGRVSAAIAGAVLLNLAIVGTLGLINRWRSARVAVIVLGTAVGAAGLLAAPLTWLMAPAVAATVLLTFVPVGVGLALLLSLPADARQWFAPR